MYIGLISDTHGVFDKQFREFMAPVDQIWHAGDFGSVEVADKIAAFKPLKGVYGNIDGGVMRRAFNEFSFFECENKRVLITHIGGYPRHYSPQAVRMIQSARPDIFIAGHSHILKVIFDPIYQLLHINPGAAGQYGFHRVRTAIRFTIDGDDIRDMEIGEWPRVAQ
jgi:putative phosphoesterase